VQTEVEWDTIERLEQIGLDEISLKKGHKDFLITYMSKPLLARANAEQEWLR
jgi:hypothetical protein